MLRRLVDFSLENRPLVLLAGGVGITPLISMLRHAVVAEPGRKVTLVLSVRDAKDIPFREELLTVSSRHPQARVVVAVTRGGGGPGLHAGRVDGVDGDGSDAGPADLIGGGARRPGVVSVGVDVDIVHGAGR